MKVKVSKTMVKELNKYAKNLEFAYRECNIDTYRTCVNYDVFGNNADYNTKTGLMKFIQVNYPSEYYALPQYLTTRELLKMLDSGDTVESYCNRVVSNMQV